MNTRKKRKTTSRNTTDVPTVLGWSILTTAFAPIYKKVHFPNEESALNGFSILLKSGGGETLGGNIYGVFSERQIELLTLQKIPFDFID